MHKGVLWQSTWLRQVREAFIWSKGVQLPWWERHGYQGVRQLVTLCLKYKRKGTVKATSPLASSVVLLVQPDSPIYRRVHPTLNNQSGHIRSTSLETPSQTYPKTCLLGSSEFSHSQERVAIVGSFLEPFTTVQPSHWQRFKARKPGLQPTFLTMTSPVSYSGYCAYDSR